MIRLRGSAQNLEPTRMMMAIGKVTTRVTVSSHLRMGEPTCSFMCPRSMVRGHFAMVKRSATTLGKTERPENRGPKTSGQPESATHHPS